jgi:O-antigen/teichoic acid export membrane protein
MSNFLVEMMFTKKFIEAIPIFNVLFWGYWISLILDPIWLIFHSAQKTRFLLYADSLMLLIIFVFNMFLIPGFGALGAAYSFVTARLMGRCMLGLFLIILNRKNKHALRVNEVTI